MKQYIEKFKHVEVKNYINNTSWLMAEYFLRLLSGVIVGAIVARYLGPAQYGIFSYALAFSALFLGLSKLGLDSLILKDLVQEDVDKNQVLGAAFYIKLFGGITGVILALISSMFLQKDHLTILYINIIAFGAIFQSFDVVDFYFQSISKVKFISYCKITQIIVSMLIKCLLIYFKAELLYFVIATLVDQLILTALYFVLAQKNQIHKMLGCFNLQRMKKVIVHGYPLLITYLVILIQGRADQLILTHYFGTTELAYFSSAIRVIDVGMVLPVALSTTFYPYVLNAFKQGEEIYFKRTKQYYLLMISFAALLICIFVLFSDLIIKILYGVEYASAALVLSMMAPRILLNSLGTARNNVLMSQGKSMTLTFTSILELTLSITLNLILIKNFKTTGIIVSSILSSVLAVLITDVIKNDSRAISPYLIFFKSKLS